jgi:hypothetical protein
MAAKLKRFNRVLRKKVVPKAAVRVKVLKKARFLRPNLIISTRRQSTGARTLAKQLGCRRWLEQNPSPLPANAIVINWGDTSYPRWVQLGTKVWNDVTAIKRATNKLETFKCLEEAKVPCLKFTQSKDEAKKWLDKGSSIFVRQHVNGTGGSGITILTGKVAEIPNAPLYTRNYPKTHEFRVHVFDGQVIDFTEKKAARDREVGNRLVRNHDNGWIFAHDNLSPDVEAKRAIDAVSVAAVAKLGLVFGAVDILAILTPGAGKRGLKSCVVCEVNTAPGLECTATIEAYKNAIIRKYEAR